VALDAVTGARPQEEGLAALGARFVGEIQAQMSNEPADSPATAARKGSSTPLEDTGALKAAITAEVSR
jgi:hypothetical protein